MFYRITVKGNVGDRIDSIFPDLEVDYDGHASTIEGPVQDQSQLHGILTVIRDLNVALLAIESSPLPP